MTVDDQRRAVDLGALIEHAFLAVTPHAPAPISLASMCGQIRQVGVEHCILSSDFGKPVLGPAVAGFARCLDDMLQQGFSERELRTMVTANPLRLLGGR